MIVSSEHLARPKYASITEEEEIPRTYEWGRIIGLREGRFSYRTIVILVQKNNSTVMRVWKQWTDERRTTRKSCSGTWRQNATIDTCSAWRWMTVQHPPGSCSKLVYCYRCSNVGFKNSSTSASPWVACKGALVQDLPHGKPSTPVSAMDSWAQSLPSWLALSCLFRWTKLQFVGPY